MVLPSVRIIVTGTSYEEPTGRNRGKLFQQLDKFRFKYLRALWVTGAATGVDEWAALHLHSYGENVYTVVPADRDHIDSRYRQHCSVYEIMPVSCGSTPSERYMARNQRMVDIAFGRDIMLNAATTVFCLAFPDEEETNRSGTWATVRRARRAGLRDGKEIIVTRFV